MIKDVEHLFTYLSAIHMSSLEKCLFRSFAHFLNWIIIFFPLELSELLIVSVINPLSDGSLQIFSPILQVASLLIVSFAVQKFLT